MNLINFMLVFREDNATTQSIYSNAFEASKSLGNIDWE